MGKGGTRSRRHGSACLLLVLWCAPVQAEVLYRCAGGAGPPRWQAVPCEAGERQRTLEYTPEPTDAAAARPAGPAKPSARKPPARAAAGTRRPTRDPARERAAAACRKAEAAARERSDAEGRRLPLRTIREREREAGRVCGR